MFQAVFKRRQGPSGLLDCQSVHERPIGVELLVGTAAVREAAPPRSLLSCTSLLPLVAPIASGLHVDVLRRDQLLLHVEVLERVTLGIVEGGLPDLLGARPRQRPLHQLVTDRSWSPFLRPP